MVTSKKGLLFRLHSKLILFSLIWFISSPLEYKQLKLKSYFRLLKRQPTLSVVPFRDLDTKEKCKDFLSKAKLISDENLDDEIIWRITHARRFVGLGDDYSFRLKRLKLAGVEFDDLILHLKRFDVLKNLEFEFYGGEGNRNLGLILHGDHKISYITKIIQYKDSYDKELNFYNSIRSLGSLSTITPNLILSTYFNGVYLITLEYIDTQSDEKPNYNQLYEVFNLVSNISTMDYGLLMEDIYIDKPQYFSNIYLLKRILYRNLICISKLTKFDVNGVNYIFSKINSMNLDKIVWSLTHGDNLHWNFKLRGGKIYILDWERYSIDIYGMDFLGYVIGNGLNLELIEDFISTELGKSNSDKMESLLILIILMFNNIKDYINGKSVSRKKSFGIIDRILEKFYEDFRKRDSIN